MDSGRTTVTLAALLAVALFSFPVSAQTTVEAGLTRKRINSGLFKTVGKITTANGICTGTLIDFDAVLTAAHCVSDSLQPTQGLVQGTFSAGAFSGPKELIEFVSYGQESGLMRGLAVILIKNLEVVKIELSLSTKAHFLGSPMVMIGYGCTKLVLDDHNHPLATPGAGTRRITLFAGTEISVLFYDSPTLRVCPGDSGGPIIDLKTNKIVALAESFHLIHQEGYGYHYDRAMFSPVFDLARALNGTEEKTHAKTRRAYHIRHYKARTWNASRRLGNFGEVQ